MTRGMPTVRRLDQGTKHHRSEKFIHFRWHAWAVFSASKTDRKGDSVPGLCPSGLW